MIGVFDSGLGGLSVLAAIASILPGAALTYCADTAHVPYGSKSDDFIRSRVLAIGDDLAARGCKIIVVACNTATAAAVDALRARHPDIPVVGIEPGIRPAAVASKSRRIAVLTTESTARSARLARLIHEHGQGVQVHIEPCPGWATRVESLHFDEAPFRSAIAAKILPLLEREVDQIVLGCTHYSFLVPVLHPLVQGRAALVDVAEAVARQVARLATPVSSSKPSSANTEQNAPLQLFATARAEHLATAFPRLGLAWLIPRIAQATQNLVV